MTWQDHTLGLLQLLLIPDQPWQHLSMDYHSFPKDKHGYNNILVIINRLSKQVVLLPCYKTTSVREMAQLFIKHVYRWKGLPDSIVSD
jgi:hypothetical protein